jgi:prostaglandin-endoperoxide synthase 2
MLAISLEAKDRLFNAICLIIGTIMFYRGIMDFTLWGDDPIRKLLGLIFFGGVIGIFLMYRRWRIGFWIFVVLDFAVGAIFIFVLQDIWHHHVWPHIMFAAVFLPFYRDLRWTAYA